MKIRHLLYYLILFAGSFCVLTGQDVKVSAKFDSTCIYIGDQIYYTVTVEQPGNVSLLIQPHNDTLISKIEILSGPESDSSLISGNRLKITNRYLVTTFDTGFYQVPPVYAELKNENGLKRYYSDYSFLQVIRVAIAPSDSTANIFDIVEPYRAPVTLAEILPWILLAVLAGALIYLVIRLLKRLKRKTGTDEIIVNPDPAHVIAFRELEKLKEELLWQKGEVKQYYSRLTEILRQYLENRYGVFSLEMTTSETLDELLKTGFRRDDSFLMLKQILNGSDLVKFAKYRPDPSENESHFANSWKFVDITKAAHQDTITDTVEKDVKEGVS